jgi:S1-C subfamily serine protease
MKGRAGWGVWVVLVGAMVAVPLSAQERPERERERAEVEARAMERAREAMERAAERLREMEERLERGERPRVMAFRGEGMEGFRAFPFDLGRGARLGVSLTVGGGEGEAGGARVEAVSPGGPADRAGIESGDVITAVGGTSVLSPLPDEGQEERALREASAPVGRVIALVRALEPGDSVQVDVLRDGAPRSFTVVTGDAGAMTFSFGPGMEGRVFEVPRVGAVPQVATLFAPGRVAGVSLVPLNPELGEYFGTSRGVLVTEVPEGSSTGLRAGDVILRIGDRDVEDVAHARRVLASYRSGEEVTFQLMRRQREETVRGRME